MKIDKSDREFQEYIRSIDYGNNDERCNPFSPQFDANFDNEAAQVAENDGMLMCTQTHRGADGKMYKAGDYVSNRQAARASGFSSSRDINPTKYFGILLLILVAIAVLSNVLLPAF